MLRRLKRGPRPTPKKCAVTSTFQNSRESSSDGMNGRRPPGGRVNDDGGDGDAGDGEPYPLVPPPPMPGEASGEATLEGTRVSTGAAGATLAVARVAAGEGT